MFLLENEPIVKKKVVCLVRTAVRSTKFSEVETIRDNLISKLSLQNLKCE